MISDLTQIASGRLVSTSTSHLQPVTAITVDPSSNFFLTGSADAMIHVWALPQILSFSPDASRSPVHTLSTHRGPISSITCGHTSSSANIAVSISADKSAIVWDYHNGQALRTYLLPEAPTAATLDPADRALYVAYGDGSIQTIDFFDDIQKATSTNVMWDKASMHRPVQPSPKARFNADSQKLGGALSLSLSWDGTSLISGHVGGKVALWDIAKGNYISTLTNLPGPVSNLHFLTPTGFPHGSEPPFKIHTVVKPKQDIGMTGNGSSLVPANYTLSMQFTGRLPTVRTSATERNMPTKSAFEEALTHPSFPPTLLEESLQELEAWNGPSKNGVAPASDFMALDDTNFAGTAPHDGTQAEVQELKKQLASLQRIQKVTFSQLGELREERDYFVDKEKKRAEQERSQAKKNHATNGVSTKDVEMRDANDTLDDSEDESVTAEGMKA